MQVINGQVRVGLEAGEGSQYLVERILIWGKQPQRTQLCAEDAAELFVHIPTFRALTSCTGTPEALI